MNTSISALLERAQALAGRTLKEIALAQNVVLPETLLHAKGKIGQLMEQCLGAQAGSLPMPDFPELGIELKTIPIDRQGKPLESTYVCVVSLQTTLGERWEESLVWKKLQKVLWVPILSSPELAIEDRQLGTPFLWQPNETDAAILQNDWEELMTLITLGRVEEITAKLGTYLHIRPKAANSRALTSGVNAEGIEMATLPRGFYLRTSFTNRLLENHFIK